MRGSLSALRDIQAELLCGVKMPNMRFFTPTESFYRAMDPYKHKAFIECGAGCGDTTVEMRNRGFSVMPVDIVERDRMPPDMLIMNAVNMPFGEHMWSLICRPDHSGWAGEVIEKTVRGGGTAFYVGLRQNLEIDLGDFLDQHSAFHPDVGDEGECMWIFKKEGG